MTLKAGARSAVGIFSADTSPRALQERLHRRGNPPKDLRETHEV